jgi:hypothetical protein
LGGEVVREIEVYKDTIGFYDARSDKEIIIKTPMEVPKGVYFWYFSRRELVTERICWNGNNKLA